MNRPKKKLKLFNYGAISSSEIAAINEGLKDIEYGRVIPHEEVKKRYEKWLLLIVEPSSTKNKL